MAVLKFATVSPVTATACEHLEAESEAYLASIYPPSSIYSVPSQTLENEGNLLLGAFRAEHASAGSPIGCVGFVRNTLDRGVAEIKRLFVSPGFRHLGVATQLMDALEEHAIEAGVTTLRLETGIYQHESLSLYGARGYVERGPFDDYPPDSYSVFLHKLLY